MENAGQSAARREKIKNVLGTSATEHHGDKRGTDEHGLQVEEFFPHSGSKVVVRKPMFHVGGVILLFDPHATIVL